MNGVGGTSALVELYLTAGVRVVRLPANSRAGLSD
jgi:hypothetical protein